MQRFGEFVIRTGGAYLPGVDMGTSVGDLQAMADIGADVSCNDEDPSPWTAIGVAAAVRAAIEHVDRRQGIEGARVLIQGAGHVGAALARDLAADGAEIIVADINAERAAAVAAEVGGSTVAADDGPRDAECDVFSPCSVAKVITPETVGRLRCRMLVGAANDTLSDAGCADLLAERDITYVPDFVSNAGGVIHIHSPARRLQREAPAHGGAADRHPHARGARVGLRLRADAVADRVRARTPDPGRRPIRCRRRAKQRRSAPWKDLRPGADTRMSTATPLRELSLERPLHRGIRADPAGRDAGARQADARPALARRAARPRHRRVRERLSGLAARRARPRAAARRPAPGRRPGSSSGPASTRSSRRPRSPARSCSASCRARPSRA